MSDNTDLSPGTQVVFPSEYEILKNILEQYEKQLKEAAVKTEEAIDKLRRNLRVAEDSSMANLAQRKLIEALSRDLAKTVKPN